MVIVEIMWYNPFIILKIKKMIKEDKKENWTQKSINSLLKLDGSV